jgi:carbon storage regulator CsrA
MEGRMLVLSRKPGERFVLIMGRYKATIEIMAISGNRTRVGVDAPQEISVVREEIRGRMGKTSRLREIA